MEEVDGNARAVGTGRDINFVVNDDLRNVLGRIRIDAPVQRAPLRCTVCNLSGNVNRDTEKHNTCEYCDNCGWDGLDTQEHRDVLLDENENRHFLTRVECQVCGKRRWFTEDGDITNIVGRNGRHINYEFPGYQDE